MAKDLPNIGPAVNSHQGNLFLTLAEYTAGGWTPEDIYKAMSWIDEWEAKDEKAPVKAIK